MSYIYKIHCHTKFQKSILNGLSVVSTSQGHHITINDGTLLFAFVADLVTMSVTRDYIS
jgi:hypothetical protein